VNRDNWLFAAFGLLFGFIAGYVLHEVMAARQPPRLVVGDVAASGANPHADGGFGGGAADPAMGGGAAPTAPGGTGGPPMAEIQRLRDAVEKNPNDADSMLQLANLNYDIKNWQRATELYERYLKLRPENADVLTDLGVTLREQGKAQDALKRFQRASQINPQHWQSRFNQAVVMGLDLQDFDGATRVLAELRTLQPDNPSINELATEIERRRSAPAAPAAPPKPGSSR